MPHLLGRLLNNIICGRADEVLRQLPDESIDCVVTSPPYWALRDYGVRGQLGLEADFRDYIAKLCHIFDEIKRVLKASGTCWVNLGDTYSTKSSKLKKGNIRLRPAAKGARVQSFNGAPRGDVGRKCLLQIPSHFAVEMINRGWLLRNEIIWHKPNCLPESVKDRFTVDYEKIFFFAKSPRYYFEQQLEPARSKARLRRRAFNPAARRKHIYGEGSASVINPRTVEASRLRTLTQGRNKRCVWSVAPRPFPGDHFAVFPPQLVRLRRAARKGESYLIRLWAAARRPWSRESSGGILSASTSIRITSGWRKIGYDMSRKGWRIKPCHVRRGHTSTPGG